jgi:hypothetical protein
MTAHQVEMSSARKRCMRTRSIAVNSIQQRLRLAPVYGWFTEGFDSRDLKEASLRGSGPKEWSRRHREHRDQEPGRLWS